MKYTFGILGTTTNTLQCVNSLLNSGNFEPSFVITPSPKPIGRKKIITKNPIHEFAISKNLPTFLVEKKIDENIKNELSKLEKPDFLLIVDFGYIIKNWLLEFAKIAPLNIHPSALPAWRGSAPAQFSILFGDTKSAVTLMIINEKMDQGPILHQEFFDVDQNWTQKDYYHHAFDLICQKLPEKIKDFAEGKIVPIQQPLESPTITAGKIDKKDSYIPFSILKSAIEGKNLDQNELLNLNEINPLLYKAMLKNKSMAKAVDRAVKAFDKWPNVWTIIETTQGEKRLKIIATKLLTNDRIDILIVQLEGKNPVSWKEFYNEQKN